MIILAALFMHGVDANSEPSRRSPQIGDTYQITFTEDLSVTAGKLSASSHDELALIEKVIGVRQDGLELEYDLPKETKAEVRASLGVWKFPVRIFKPKQGPTQLLNRAELEARVQRWLNAAKWSRTDCGHWISAWPISQINCDPETAIETVEAFDLTSVDARDGAIYRDLEGLGTALLKRRSISPDGATFVAKLPVDPDVIRRERAEAELAESEKMGKPTTLHAALAQQAKNNISGTISLTFHTDAEGDLLRQNKRTIIEVQRPDWPSTRSVRTETLERRLIATPISRLISEPDSAQPSD